MSRRSLAGLHLSVCAFALCAALPALAEPLDLNLEVQPLGQALREVARKGGISIAVDGALVDGKAAPALKGRYEVADALRDLLAGSGLTLTVEGRSAMVTRPTGEVELDRMDVGDVALPRVTVEDTAVKGPRIGEPANAEGHKNYVVTKSSTGSKVDTPNLDVPQDVVVVPAKILDEQDTRNVTAATQNVAGVFSAYPGYYPLDNMTSLYIRGFQVSSTLRDGLWDPTPFGNSWMGDVDRVEVVKGPAGLLYGAYSGDIGGVINVITKAPKKEASYAAETEFDSFGSRAVRGDVSQPLTKDKNWLMRVNVEEGVYESFAKRTEVEKRAGNIVLQGKVTEDDAVTMAYEKRWQQSQPYSGTLGYAQKGSGTSARLVALGDFPTSMNVYDPRSEWTYESDTGRFKWEHAFNDRWSFQTSNQYTVTSRDVLSISATPVVDGAGNVVYHQSFSNIHMGPVEAVDTDNLIHGKFSVIGHDNDMIMGQRYARMWYDMNMSANTPMNKFYSYTFTDPTNPNWGQPTSNLHRSIYGYSQTSQNNTYLNDVLSLTDNLKLSAGLNWVRYETYSESGSTPATVSGSKTTGDGLAWRAGLIYEFLPGVAAFGDYATTFKPQGSNTTNDGVIQDFDPLTGEQRELGVKVDISNRASMTAAVYQMTLQNQTMSDPDATRANLGYLVSSGEQRSRGAELDGNFLLMPGWNMLLSYAYTEARIKNSSSYVADSRVPNVPTHSMRLWSTYELQSGPLAGLGLGGGARLVSSRTTNLVSQSTPNLYATMPGYAVFDAVAYYPLTENVKATLNVNNIFDNRYTESASSYTWLYEGAPMNAVLRLKMTF